MHTPFSYLFGGEELFEDEEDNEDNFLFTALFVD